MKKDGSRSFEKILVTGAGRGIGRAVAIALAKKGHEVAILSRTQADLDSLQSELGLLGFRIETFCFDLRNLHGINELVIDVAERLGGLSALINCAGIAHKADALDVDPEKWDELIQVNLLSVMHLSLAAGRIMRPMQRGALINISSIGGKITSPRNAAYCASKYGLMGFAGSLFEDVREYGIKVCNICPGIVNTDMVKGRNLDSEKMIQCQDVANTVIFVLEFSSTTCPTEIVLRPQFSPYRD